MRVLGPETYGLYSIILAVSFYFIVILDWGINIFGVQQIAVEKDNIKNRNYLISNILGVKSFLLILLVPLTFLIFYQTNLFDGFSSLFFLAWLLVIGKTFLLDWFFIGVEKVQTVTITIIVLKSIMAVLIFIFINSPNDLKLLFIFQAFANILISISLLIIIKVKYEFIFNFNAFFSFKSGIKNSIEYFISNLARSLYTQTAVILLGVYESKEVAGYFSVADNIRYAFQSIFSNLSSALFPSTSLSFKQSREAGIKRIVKLLKLVPYFIVVIVIAELFASKIVFIIAGEKYLESVPVLMILLPSIIFIVISTILGMHLFANIGYKKRYMNIILFNSIIHLPIVFYLINILSLFGAGLSILITEILISITFIYKSKKILRTTYFNNKPNAEIE